MTSFWTPEVWDRFSAFGLLLAIGTVHAAAYVRGWLIPGRHHREIVDARDRELGEVKARSVEQDKTIQIQAKTISDKNVVEAVTTQLMQQIKGLAEGRRE